MLNNPNKPNNPHSQPRRSEFSYDVCLSPFLLIFFMTELQRKNLGSTMDYLINSVIGVQSRATSQNCATASRALSLCSSEIFLAECMHAVGVVTKISANDFSIKYGKYMNGCKTQREGKHR
jgi:hypothetical protein